MRKHGLLAIETEDPGKILVRHHEGAIVGSLEQTVSGSGDVLKNLIRDTVAELSCWTAEQGGLVGHIKASLETPTGTRVFSCTGDEVQTRDIPETGDQLMFTAIVFFVDEEQLKKRLEGLSDQLRQIP